MPITLPCPSCGQTLSVPESSAGKRARCPGCGEVFHVPQAAADVGGYAAKPGAPPVGGANRKPCSFCGEMIVATAINCRFCGADFGPSPNPYVSTGAEAAAYRMGPLPYTEEEFRNLYLWFVILFLAGIPLTCLGVGIFMMIAAVVLQYIMLYRFWSVIQDGQVSTTPGMAVGFCFIPIFNFYWIFIAYYGLAKDMERYCAERSLPCQSSADLAMTYCILNLCCLIPYLNILAILVNLVLMFILWNQLKETAITILRYHQGEKPVQEPAY